MTLRTLVALLAAGTAVVAAAPQEQEVRIVTSTAPAAPGGAAAVQPLAKGDGVIFGQITEADSTRPVPGAIVTLSVAGNQLRVMADAQGRFGFRDLPAGRYAMTATRAGWVDGAYGRTRPGGPTLPLGLADGERLSGVTIPIWRYGAITGTVRDDAGDPIVNIPVRVLRRTTVGGRVRLQPLTQDMTDDRGTYRIGNLEPGEYMVAVPMQRPSNGAPIVIDGAMREMAVREVVAVRGAAMAGGGGNMVFFNESGSVSAGVDEEGRPLTYPTQFYPNAPASTRGTLLTVASGEEKPGIDFQMKGVPAAKVSGVAMGPDGPANNLQITLVPQEADDQATPIEVITGFSDGQGRFTIEGVPTGQYVLRAVRSPSMAMSAGDVQTIQQGGMTMMVRTVTAGGAPPLPTEPTLWAEMQISVGKADLADLSVGLRPGVKLTGMVQFNGGAERPTADGIGALSIMLEPADQRPGQMNARGRVEASGQFATMGVPPGRYFVRIGGGYRNWTFHSVMVNGRDASVVPVELDSDVGGVLIAFTDRPSELTGQVTTNAEVQSATVLVFPADQQAWSGYGSQSRRFATARPDKAGNFRIQNLPAGDYLAVAIPDKMASDWQNPKFLETLVAEATRVRLGDGDKATASLKVAR